MSVLEMLGELFNTASIATWLMLLLCIALAYWYTSRKQTVSRLPPGPPALPILGSLPFFKSTDTLDTLNHFQEKYGDMYTMEVGMFRIVVLHSYPLIKEVLIKNGTATAGRDGNTMGFYFRNNDGIFISNGDKWVEQRRYTMHTLKDFGLGKNLMERFILAELDNLLAIFDKNCGKPYYPRKDLQLSAANVVTSFAFGRIMERDNPSFQHIVKSIERFIEVSGGGSLLVVFPFLRHLPFFDITKYRALKRHTLQVIDCIKQWIDEAKKDIQLNDEDDCSAFLGSYLKEAQKRKGEKGTYFSDEQLQWIILDLYSAGIDTTATTIAWITLYLTVHPDVQKKVHQELDEVVGQSRRPVMMDKIKLPYCEAVLNEVMRMADLIPLFSRLVLEDIHLRGYDVPAGTTFIVNLNSCHRDPEMFPDPHRFDPTRFLDENGKFKKNEAFIPFSIGKRACAGESLARNEAFVFFVAIFQRFSFRVPDGHPAPSTRGKVGALSVPPPFEVIMTKRF